MATGITKTGKYRARFIVAGIGYRANGKKNVEHVHLGTYDTKEEAEAAVEEYKRGLEEYKRWCEEFGLPY